LKAGNLLPSKQGKGIPMFREFAQGWWDYDTCEYLQARKERRPMSRSYALKSKHDVENHLIPAFGDRRLDTITDVQVDTWLTTFRKRVYADKAGNEKQYKAHTANNVFLVLNVMLKQAVKKGIIKTNPCANVSILNVNDGKAIEILTPE
jgi:ribosomal protein S20